MKIELASHQASWNSWLTEHGGSFLQSWEWGEILKSEGKTVERLQVIEDGVVVAEAQVVHQKTPLGWYGFCAGGPVVNIKYQISNIKSNPNDQIYKMLIEYLKKRNCIFFRVEPSFVIRHSSFVILKSLDLTPRATTILDLAKSEAELLAAMHEKTRYNIRLARKKNLAIRSGKDFDSFWRLSETTAKRDGFRLHPEKHYRAVLASPLAYQITIHNGKRPIAAAIFVGFGGTFTYLFGASDHEFRNLMAPHLAQWEGIKLGKYLGYKKYDFFGIAPRCHSESRTTRDEESLNVGERDPSVAATLPQDDKYQYDPHHQYAGVTRFKLGFGGKSYEAPGTYDLIISPIKYRVYQSLRRLRRLL